MSPLGGSKPGAAASPPAEEQVCEWWQRGGNRDCGLKLRPLMYVPRGAITWLLGAHAQPGNAVLPGFSWALLPSMF